MSQKPNDVADLLTRYAVDEHSGCWIWTRYKDQRGYGITSLNGKLMKAHRLFYENLVSEIPPGAVVCHRCDNPSCVNPNHLFVGTQRDNILDCIRKGRARRRDQRGTKNHQAKLTESQVLEIRYSESGPQGQIAKRYGVTQTIISDIRRGVAWTHI